MMINHELIRCIGRYPIFRQTHICWDSLHEIMNMNKNPGEFLKRPIHSPGKKTCNFYLINPKKYIEHFIELASKRHECGIDLLQWRIHREHQYYGREIDQQLNGVTKPASQIGTAIIYSLNNNSFWYKNQKKAVNLRSSHPFIMYEKKSGSISASFHVFQH